MNPEVERCVRALLRGELVILPTETVYGLAGTEAALPALYAAKGARGDKPFPIQIPLHHPLQEWVHLPPAAEPFLAAWPGPLTLVLRLKRPWFTYSETIALRCPDHALTQQVLRTVGPLAVPSANRSNERPPRTLEEAVQGLLPACFEGLQGGPGSGKPSRVVRILDDTPEILRQ